MDSELFNLLVPLGLVDEDAGFYLLLRRHAVPVDHELTDVAGEGLVQVGPHPVEVFPGVSLSLDLDLVAMPFQKCRVLEPHRSFSERFALE